MRKNLTRHGNSLALVIDKPILELIGADANTTFEITTDGRNLTLNPIREADRKEVLREALRLTNEQFGYDLKKLAE